MKPLFRSVVGAIGVFALGLQYWLVAAHEPGGPGIAQWTIRYFSYFTILTNLLAALAMILPLAAARRAPGRFFARPSVRTAITVYIVIVGAVYVLILRHVWEPRGWFLVADGLLHYVMPVLVVADWLVFVSKGGLRWRAGLVWLVFPLVYLAWTLAHGAVAAWYPYPFVDVAKLGYPTVLANCAALLAVFLGLGLGFVALGRLLGRSRTAAADA